MTKKTDTINILITPQHTLLGDEIIHPGTISLVLENGHSYDLDIIVNLLEKHDKKTQPRFQPIMRTKRFFRAVKTALDENE